MSALPPDVDGAIRDLRTILETVRPRLLGLSEPAAATPFRPGGWSRKQILGHLIDSAANNHQRFVRAQIDEALTSPAYAQKEWVEVQGYAERNWEDLVRLWASYNEHLLFVAARIPASRHSVRCRIGPDDPVTLEFLVRDYVRHLQYHLGQILPDLASTT